MTMRRTNDYLLMEKTNKRGAVRHGRSGLCMWRSRLLKSDDLTLMITFMEHCVSFWLRFLAFAVKTGGLKA